MRKFIFGISASLVLTSTAANVRADACSQNAKALASWVQPLAALKSAEPNLLDDASKLVEGDGEAVVHGPMIRVRSNGMLIDGHAVRTAADVKAILDQSRSAYERVHQRPFQGAVLLAVDGDGRWGDVDVAIKGARDAKYRAMQVLYTKRRATKITAPAPSRIDPEIAKRKHPGTDRGMTGLIRYLEPECPSLQRHLDSLASVPELERDIAFAAGLEKAIVDCHCKVSRDNLNSVIFEMVRPNDLERAVVQTTLALPAAATAETLKLPRATLWSVAGPKLLDAARRAPNHFVQIAAE